MSKPHLAGAANGKYMGEKQCHICGEPARYKTKRLCQKHYDAMRTRGTVVPYVKPRDYCVVCSVEAPKATIRQVKGHGLCVKHYWQWRRNVLRGEASGTSVGIDADLEGRSGSDERGAGERS